MIGRLREDVGIGEAQADLMTLASHLEPARGSNAPAALVTVYPIRALAPELAGPASIFTGMLLAVVGLVLLIGCVNIANLLLARSIGRQREVGVRIALGATRRRLVQQMLTESLLLSLVGTAIAALLAYLVSRPAIAAASRLPLGPPIALDFALDWRIAAGALTLTLLTTLGFGLMPAVLVSRTAVAASMKESAVTAGPRRKWLRASFVSTQVAMSTVLLVLAALLIRAVGSARTLDRGFSADGVVTIRIDLESAGYTAARGLAFYDRLLDALAHDSRVAAATVVDMVPLTLSNRADEMMNESDAPRTVLVYSNVVSPGHFRTLGIQLLTGRDFNPGDRAGSPAAAIVNETLARQFWPGENPIGKRLRSRDDNETPRQWLEVVGVARDSKYVTVGEDRKPFLYRPLGQAYVSGGTLIVKGSARDANIVASVREAVHALDPDLPIFGVTTLESATAVSLLPITLAAAIAGALGVAALALGAIGLYGVMSSAVRQRTREIGIRMALGAEARAVVRLVTRSAMRWTAAGIGAGLAAALGAASVIAGFLYGVAPWDPLSFVLIPLLLVSTAYAACYLPARRASRIDPVVALRDE
jgi:predicted permease